MTLAPDVAPVLDHLDELTGDLGLYEHALYDRPRVEHGYTTDDNARCLVVLCRHAETFGNELELQPYLDFVVSGAVSGGWHNRMGRSGEWSDLRGSDDAHGRAIWGLGETVRSGRADETAMEALRAGLVSFKSTHPRAIAYAAMGAVAILGTGAVDDLAFDFLTRVGQSLPYPRAGAWKWPAPRLTYANGRIPEAMILMGAALDDMPRLAAGLELLGWLVDIETGERGFSFTPVDGRGPDARKPAYDQQPVEAWAMADACFAAYEADGDTLWRRATLDATRWFLGRNDAGLAVYDGSTGAGFDGLGNGHINQNRGAESTLAALASLIRQSQLTDNAVRR